MSSANPALPEVGDSVYLWMEEDGYKLKHGKITSSLIDNGDPGNSTFFIDLDDGEDYVQVPRFIFPDVESAKTALLVHLACLEQNELQAIERYEQTIAYRRSRYEYYHRQIQQIQEYQGEQQ